MVDFYGFLTFQWPKSLQPPGVPSIPSSFVGGGSHGPGMYTSVIVSIIFLEISRGVQNKGAHKHT